MTIFAPWDLDMAIEMNADCYYDEYEIHKMKSGGGYRCRQCRTWIRPTSRDKHREPTYLITCDACKGKKNDR